jgi:hypothetical protein
MSTKSASMPRDFQRCQRAFVADTIGAASDA